MTQLCPFVCLRKRLVIVLQLWIGERYILNINANLLLFVA